MANENEITSTRTFSYNRETVFDAYTNPSKLKLWWGPNGFTNTFHEYDFKPGGNWHFTMHGPDGANYKNHIVFVRIETPKKLILNHISPPVFQIEISFSELDGKTTVVFKMVFDTVEECNKIKELVIPSNEENFDRLAFVLEN